MDFIQANLIDPISKVLYSYVLIYVLVAVGIYFTIRTKFIQVRYFRRMLNQVLHSRTTGEGISSFQAFCIGLASRVGTGNIAGVAIALTLGGPGAIFWMWVVAAIGMATALIEATLGQLFKVRTGDGTFRGGPAFYIQRGLGSRPGGILFAVLLVFTFGIAFNMLQANAISDVLSTSHNIEVHWTTIGLVILAAPVLFGGVKRVAKVAEFVLPLMALAYVALALVIVAMNITNLPHVLSQIIGGAFGLHQMAGGIHRRDRRRDAQRRQARAVLQRGRHGQRAQRRGDRHRLASGQTGSDPVAGRVRRHHDHLLGNGFHHHGVRPLGL